MGGFSDFFICHSVILGQQPVHPASICSVQGQLSQKLLRDSDCLRHDATAVAAFQAALIPHIKNKYSGLKIIHYFTDGAASQYKNKSKFSNVSNHAEDFRVQCKWTFFTTSHGKNARDDVGGAINLGLFTEPASSRR